MSYMSPDVKNRSAVSGHPSYQNRPVPHNSLSGLHRKLRSEDGCAIADSNSSSLYQSCRSRLQKHERPQTSRAKTQLPPEDFHLQTRKPHQGPAEGRPRSHLQERQHHACRLPINRFLEFPRSFPKFPTPLVVSAFRQFKLHLPNGIERDRFTLIEPPVHQLTCVFQILNLVKRPQVSCVTAYTAILKNLVRIMVSDFSILDFP
ncbi:hypothetical protein COPCOM_03014 [Coprococcus comes ATCC 27758]|uniref:Uncharacterized protein n=1 Tax=Coprococcus comes ATCC 27758 TaxID=470146 RepID=C0BCX3_9FIRM|nr:hypothetical protein COPCOM_03014 [Coprococcus comes ATCC 27758]